MSGARLLGDILVVCPVCARPAFVAVVQAEEDYRAAIRNDEVARAHWDLRARITTLEAELAAVREELLQERRERHAENLALRLSLPDPQVLAAALTLYYGPDDGT